MSLWVDLSKARKGERVGGSYLHRWWKNGRWNYKYSDKPHKNHGIAHSAKDQHSISLHGRARDMPAEQAFHYSRDQEMKRTGTTHEAIYPGPSGRPAFKVTVKPGNTKPIVVVPVGEDVSDRDAERKDNFRGLEGWHRRQSTTQTVYDAFGQPWFDVRKRAEGDSNRLSVRYHSSSPFARRDDEEWVGAPVMGGPDELNKWANHERRRQLESKGRKTAPSRKFPEDSKRPATSNLEHGKVRWRSRQVPLKGRASGIRWVRESVFRSDKDRKKFVGQVMAEHFGLVVTVAAAQLRRANLARKATMAIAMEHMIGMDRRDRNKRTVAIDRSSPAYRAVVRAVDSYDPGKGWKFSNWLGECMWWESRKDINAAYEKVRREREGISISKEGKDIFEDIDLGERTPEQRVIEKDLLHDWKVRQEDRIARHMFDHPEDHEVTIEALYKMQVARDLDEARSIVVQFQSEGGADFAEFVSEKDLPQPKPTKRDKSVWKTLIKDSALSPQQKILLMELAPDGNLANMRSFDEVSKELPKKYKREFPTKPTLPSVVDMFMDAHAQLSGHPEFEAMREKISAIDKAIDLLRKISSERMDAALDILHKSKKGSRAKTYKYHRREGIPGHYKYWYHDAKKNWVQATNAPKGHAHHEEHLGDPKLHSSEPDLDKSPEFFDNSGRKMNQSIPEHAEWNQDYNPSIPRNMWAARWTSDPNDPGSKTKHGYYDSDMRDRSDLKYNVMNRHFDEQLPKVRGFYKQMMRSQHASSQALGLMIALLDQAKMRVGKKQHEMETGHLGLCTLKVKNVELKGNQATFDYIGKSGVQQIHKVVLDSRARGILEGLIKSKGKKKGDYLFSVPARVGDRIIHQEVGYNKLIRNLRTLGVTPRQFRTYHGTETYSQEFQRQYSALKGRATPEILQKIAENAAIEAGKVLGHFMGEGEDRKAHAHTALRSYIDPIAIRSLYLNALDETQKSHKLMGRMEYQGMPISIENKKGSVRKWYDPHGEEGGETKMNFDYGYIRRTMGTDGDHIDVYIGPNLESENAYVVHQRKKPDFKKFDEDKVMLGFDSEAAAKAAYLKQYDDPRFFGSMTTIPMERFKRKVFETPKNPQMIKSIVWFAH